MTKILGISGKKQSGKTTVGNFLYGCAMLDAGIVDYAAINDNGKLVVPYHHAHDETRPCVFPVESRHKSITSYMQENVWSKIKVYNFADTLKNVCMEVLGLSYEQCYGSDTDKNSDTDVVWGNMPVQFPFKPKRNGQQKMTAREVLQYIGTDIFRCIKQNVWVESTIRKIQSDSPDLAVIVDCRFPNEVEGIQDAGGKVIRLSRNMFGDQDQHRSETALDNCKTFDCVIDNQDMNVQKQNEAVYNQLFEWGFINYEAAAGFVS
tara:strand:+ start:503 stop:1291 length:789 start_codon:yes stop_codon:yes gene_type:complete